MGIFKSAHETHQERLDEEFLFGAAAQEIATGAISPGLYAKALTECGGDEKLTSTHYIKLRVEMMKSERSAMLERERLAQSARSASAPLQSTETVQRPSYTKLDPVVRTLATLLGLLLAATPFFMDELKVTHLIGIPAAMWLAFCGITGRSFNPFTGKAE